MRVIGIDPEVRSWGEVIPVDERPRKGRLFLPVYEHCTVDGCTRPHDARGMCFMHYHRWKTHGDPLTKPPRKERDPEPFFWRRVRLTDGCWLWLGEVDKDGYGKHRIFGRRWMVHRLVYEQVVGEIPDGLVLDHLCNVRNCCRPEHLEPVTTRENVLRWARKITHCPQGHPYDEENTGYQGGGTRRRCRACARDYSREYARRKAQRCG